MRENTVTYWRMGDDDMAEWHEKKGDEFFVFADFYKGEAAKAFKAVCVVLDSSDSIMHS